VIPNEGFFREEHSTYRNRARQIAKPHSGPDYQELFALGEGILRSGFLQAAKLCAVWFFPLDFDEHSVCCCNCISDIDRPGKIWTGSNYLFIG
jgi:hypothetical protein